MKEVSLSLNIDSEEVFITISVNGQAKTKISEGMIGFYNAAPRVFEDAGMERVFYNVVDFAALVDNMQATLELAQSIFDRLSKELYNE